MRIAGLAGAALALLVAAPLVAGETGIEITDPWARPSLPDRPTAGYLTIENKGGASDRLTGARAEGVGTVELHSIQSEDGIVRMERIEAIEIPAGAAMHLLPGGLHLMMMDLEAPLEEGDSLQVTLVFEQAGEIEATLPVTREAPDGAETGADGQGAHGHESHDGGGVTN